MTPTMLSALLDAADDLLVERKWHGRTIRALERAGLIRVALTTTRGRVFIATDNGVAAILGDGAELRLV